jgi:hypothetical protein
MNRIPLLVLVVTACALALPVRASADPLCSTTVLSTPQANNPEVTVHFDLDKSTGNAGLRSVVHNHETDFVDIKDCNDPYHYHAVDGLSYNPLLQSATYRVHGKTTICGYFTDDYDHARTGIKKLLAENKGTLKKRFGADYIEFVSGERKGERIYIKNRADGPFFIPTGNCAFREKKDQQRMQAAYKSRPIKTRDVVMNVYAQK